MKQDLEPDQETPSKTRRKKDMLSLQRLGQELLTFNQKKLSQLPLTPILRNALDEYKRLPNSREARRRQMQFIGRLMRDVDYIQVTAAIAEYQEKSHRPSTSPARAAAICKQLLDGGDVAIQALLAESPHLERQTLRHYCREYSRADETQRSAIKARLLKYIETPASI
ncbi:MAG: ribosome biogenesis factor YjgA [Pseudohongiellaceae bacterium]